MFFKVDSTKYTQIISSKKSIVGIIVKKILQAFFLTVVNFNKF